MTIAAQQPMLPGLHVPMAVPVNRLLRTAAWARDRLRPFSGKTVRFNCVPFIATLTILDNGEVRHAEAAVSVDVEYTLTPGIALRALASDGTAWREIKISGDNTLASAVAYVAQHLRWDVEEDLSRVFGDVVAHRVARTGAEIMRTQRQLVDDFIRSLTAYWTEEQPLLVNHVNMTRFKRDADALRNDVEQLAQRVEALRLRR